MEGDAKWWDDPEMLAVSVVENQLRLSVCVPALRQRRSALAEPIGSCHLNCMCERIAPAWQSS